VLWDTLEIQEDLQKSHKLHLLYKSLQLWGSFGWFKNPANN